MDNQITVAKAAEMVGVSKNTIYKNFKTGKMSYVSNDSGKMIDMAELLRVYPTAKNKKEPVSDTSNIEIQYLKEKIEDLKTQLAESRERERRVMDMLAIKINEDNGSKKQGFISRILGN